MGIRILILFLLLTTDGFASFKVEDKSLLVVHPSKHYHTNLETIIFSNNLAKEFQESKRAIIGLAQQPIDSDPLWYIDRTLITHEISSRMGEHELKLTPQQKYEFTILGGYHSACLGRATANLISNSFDKWSLLKIYLPTRGIFTGFQFKHGKLFPSVDQESWADSSIDGLNLYQVTQSMNDKEWVDFIRQSLDIAIFQKRPIKQLNLEFTKFEIYRNSKKMLSLQNGNEPIKKVIRIYYLDTNNFL